MKMYLSSFILLVSFVHYARAQSSASAYVEPTVPTGKPIQGDYNGALRPQIHYSPPIDFMVSRYRPKDRVRSNHHKLFTEFDLWCGLLAGVASPTTKSAKTNFSLGTFSDKATE